MLTENMSKFEDILLNRLSKLSSEDKYFNIKICVFSNKFGITKLYNLEYEQSEGFHVFKITNSIKSNMICNIDFGKAIKQIASVINLDFTIHEVPYNFVFINRINL